MSALATLAISIAVSAVVFVWFAIVDIRAWRDGRPETLTASTVIRAWASEHKARMSALTLAILSPIILVVWLLGHFPLGLW